MGVPEFCFTLVFLFTVDTTFSQQDLNTNKLEDYYEQNTAVSNETINAYDLGVHMGIINPEKYPLKSFERHEIEIFKNLYKEYNLVNGSQPINYIEWLVMNNFGILSDTQESLLGRKITKRSLASNKKIFTRTVRKGDILIAGRGIGGLVGHAAIMTSDYWVLEMAGGRGWETGIPDNNRQIGKDDWYEENSADWVTVYRCPDKTVARDAAIWADYEYFNPNGGGEKVKHITYFLQEGIWNTNPSYCAKLVMQAYFFGTGNKRVTKNLARKVESIIAPSRIPSYFHSKYELQNKGKF